VARQDLVTELFYSGAWNTAAAYDRDSVTVTRGRGDEQGEAVPSEALATLDNRDGDANPRNPTSALYGLAGRNTPMRHYLGTQNMLGAGGFDVSNVASHVAPSLDAPAAGLLICAWAAPFNVPSGQSYTLPASMSGSGVSGTCDNLRIQGGRQTVTTGATGTRTATISTADEYVSASVFIKGPTTWTTGTLAPAGTSFNLDVVDPGDLWVVITAFASDGDTDPPFAPAYPADTDGGGWQLLADTGNVLWDDAAAKWGRMKAWIKKGRTVNSNHTVYLPGADPGTTVSFATRVAAATVDDSWDIRHVGEVASWRPDRTAGFDAGLGDAWTKVDSAGILRRLGQGNPPALSAIRRTIAATNPGAYWPMEDGDDAGRFGPGLLGGSPMTVIAQGGVDLAADDSLPGSAPLPTTVRNLDVESTMSAGGPLSGLSSSVTVGAWVSLPDKGSQTTDFGNFFSIVIYYAGGEVEGMVVSGTYDPSTGDETWFVDNGHGTLGISDAAVTHSQEWRWVRATIEQSGTSMRTRLWIDESLIDDVTDTSTTLGTPVRAVVNLDAGSDGTNRKPEYLPVSIGHVAIWDGAVTPADMLDAGAGWVSETAGDRFLRLCKEAGISGSLVGDPDDTPPMGPQPVDTLVGNFAEIERTDGGILYEPRSQLGAAYRIRKSLYNQTAALALDWDQKQVAPPLTPAFDDQHVRNDITAKRPNGSSYHVEQSTGPLNVNLPQEDSDGVGRYQVEISVNPETDSALPDLAGWYLHLGTVDETRFPQVTVDLDRSPDLADEASAVDIGDLITIDNLPDDLSADQLQLIVVGYTETLEAARRTITFNCRPAAPYNVGVYGTARYQTGGTERQGLTIDSTQTSITFHITDGAFWTTKAGSFPFDIMVNGERMTVTAIGAPSSDTQSFTVQRSRNGVVKSHPTGVKAVVINEARYAL
jgi:hypothetical protein